VARRVRPVLGPPAAERQLRRVRERLAFAAVSPLAALAWRGAFGWWSGRRPQNVNCAG
jgi:hypothetical protein